MSLIIDGYNLMHAAGIVGRGAGPGFLERSRLAVLNFVVESLEPAALGTTTVVFDARQAPPGLPRELVHRGVKVHFASGYESADELIEELIEPRLSVAALAYDSGLEPITVCTAQLAGARRTRSTATAGTSKRSPSAASGTAWRNPRCQSRPRPLGHQRSGILAWPNSATSHGRRADRQARDAESNEILRARNTSIRRPRSFRKSISIRSTRPWTNETSRGSSSGLAGQL